MIAIALVGFPGCRTARLVTLWKLRLMAIVAIVLARIIVAGRPSH